MINYLIVILLYLIAINLVLIGDVLATKVKPNIVIFLSDDLGWYDVGYHGSRHLRTPNIDSLAADGIILNRYYTQPLCSPSRGALLTGIHPIHSGTQNFVLLGAAPWGLPLRHKLMPEYLKDLGYSTHGIGKWHLGFYRPEYVPTRRGFDSHTGFWNGFEDYYNHRMSERGFTGFDFRHNLEVSHDADGQYSTDYYTRSAVNLIDKHNSTDGRPLFLYMSYQSVHAANKDYELQAPQELIDKFSYIQDINRRKFAAILYSMDVSIGRIVQSLHQKNILNNTIILFMSDNGGAISGFMENSASNYPLRGTKGSLWEGGVRVPAFIWSPLLPKSGFVSETYVQGIDWLPTLLEAIGDSKQFSDNHYNRFDGISVWRTLSDKTCPKRQQEVLLNIDPIWNMSSIIWNQWKLIQGSVPSDMSPKSDHWSQSFESNVKLNASHREDYSLVHKVLHQIQRKPNYNVFNETAINCGFDKKQSNCDLTRDLCLFNILSDPCEYNNVAKDYPIIVAKLWQKILNYNRTAVQPLNQPIDPKANPILHNNTWSNWVFN